MVKEARDGRLSPPIKYESRFHILKHTNFLVCDKNGIRLRSAFSQSDSEKIKNQINTINAINAQFTGFHSASNAQGILAISRSCEWGKYFDSLNTLKSEDISSLTDYANDVLIEDENIETTTDVEIKQYQKTYQLKLLNFKDAKESKRTNKKTVYADPDATKVKRQKANLTHRSLLEKLYAYLEENGAQSLENEHIDLYSKLKK